MTKFSAIFAVVISLFLPVVAAADDMRMAVTTSFHNSGLADVLLPEIKKDLGLDVHLLVVGTGQALRLGRAGDVDAILVHSRKAEEEFVEKGFGTHRREIMYNDFVVIGPSADPAGVGGAKSAAAAFQKIAAAKTAFASRGDDSGTHRKERSLWNAAGLDDAGLDTGWYRASGSGMGATLNMASALNAYVFADRASWLNFGNKGELALLFAGDPVLFNQYAYIQVSPTRHPHVKKEQAAKLEEWLAGERAQQLIGGSEIAGETLFTPNAQPR
ncbi:substrate-binding domain-containing protein [Sneathiella chinensis]|uniref:Tungsten ABC transporter substrate-binding protein n=1 Tax=Sneathiella chinensis TaxID=349750 RepID=A0ABQ5U280_9PROT|nr:substrate-binding domain-containing protein [Sneathiella chinensis]GLQ05948.1 tungsten ABC transporter substrate-binding protein [Sneathiella chinensis]